MVIKYSISRKGFGTSHNCKGVISVDEKNYSFRIKKWKLLIFDSSELVLESYATYNGFWSRIFDSPEVVFPLPGRQELFFCPHNDFFRGCEKTPLQVLVESNVTGEYLCPTLGGLKMSCKKSEAESALLEGEELIHAMCVFITKWTYWNRVFFS
jgi:hypothetical protein